MDRTPAGELVIGVSDAYRFEIRNPDGTVVHVRMEWAPVVLDADEKAEWQALLDWQWERQREFMAGEMEPVPDRKPAYHRMIGGLDGTMWVQRHAPVGTRIMAFSVDTLWGVRQGDLGEHYAVRLRVPDTGG